MTDIGGDVFDIRDLIERFDELESTSERDEEENAELEMLRAFLDDVCGKGDDHQWRGDWYPVTFICDSYFTEYARELAKDIGAIPKDASWPAYCIDWERAARDLRKDYLSVELDGATYWYR